MIEKKKKKKTSAVLAQAQMGGEGRGLGNKWRFRFKCSKSESIVEIGREITMLFNVKLQYQYFTKIKKERSTLRKLIFNRADHSPGR